MKTMGRANCIPAAADIAEFHERGHWITPKLLDDDRIARLRAAAEGMFEGKIDGDGWYFDSDKRRDISGDPTQIVKFTNGWWINDEVKDLVLDPLLGEIAAVLLSTDEVRLWHDQVIKKPGSSGKETPSGNVGWHQDYAYWTAANTPNMCTAWIALQDTDLENGGMRTLVGSHKTGLIEDADTFYDSDLDALEKRFKDRVGNAWIDEPCILKAGQASIHHALCFHGSGPNLTNRPRLSVVAHYMPKGTAYNAHTTRHRNVKYLGPRPKHGQLFNNEYFPVAWPSKPGNTLDSSPHKD